MTLMGHFRTDRGPGKGAYPVADGGAKTRFFWRGAGTLVVGSCPVLDSFAQDGDTDTVEPGGDPANATYPNDSRLRNLIPPTNGGANAQQTVVSGTFVLITDLLGNGGVTDTEVEGVFEAYDVDISIDGTSNAVVDGQQASNIVSLNADAAAEPIVDAVAAGGEKIIARPLAALAVGGGTVRCWFSGDLGWGYA